MMNCRTDSLQAQGPDEEAFRQCVRVVSGVVAAYLVGFVLITKVLVPFLVLGCF